MQITLSIIIYFVIFIFLLSLINPTANIFFHFAILKKHYKIKFESDYFRNILKYSPSEILYILKRKYKKDYLSDTNNIIKYKKLFLINLLKMDLLKYISIDYTNKENFEITKKDKFIEENEYKLIYDYIFNTITQKNKIKLYDIYNYIDNNPQTDFYKQWNSIINKNLETNGYYSTNFIEIQEDSIKTYYKVSIVLLVILNIYIFTINAKSAIFICILIPLLMIFGYKEAKKMQISTENSVYEYKKIKALKKFLKDFTLIKDKDLEYIKLLEDYIVYASIFDMYDTNIEKLLERVNLEIKHSLKQKNK